MDAVAPIFAAAVECGRLPDVDTAVVLDMQAMRARLESDIEAKVRREVIERSATLDLDDLFESLDVVTLIGILSPGRM